MSPSDPGFRERLFDPVWDRGWCHLGRRDGQAHAVEVDRRDVDVAVVEVDRHTPSGTGDGVASDVEVDRQVS